MKELGGRDQSRQFRLVTHFDDLPRVLGHLLEHEGHLLVREGTPLEVLLGEGREELGVTAREPNPIVVGRGLGDLLVVRLILLEDADEGLEGPNLVGAELGDRKSTRLNSSHVSESRMPSSA